MRKPPNAAASAAAHSRVRMHREQLILHSDNSDDYIHTYELWYAGYESLEYYRLRIAESDLAESVLVDTEGKITGFYGMVSRQLTPVRWTSYGMGILSLEGFRGARFMSDIELKGDQKKD